MRKLDGCIEERDEYIIYEKGDKKAIEITNKLLKDVYTKIGLVVD